MIDNNILFDFWVHSGLPRCQPTTTELVKITPAFGWQVYFAKVGMPSSFSLNVTAPGFFKAMNEELGAASLADWKTYLRWHLVDSDAPHLSSAFVDENFAFYGKILQGKERLRPRWKRCTDDVDTHLGEALGRAYVDKYFGPEAKQKAVKMVKEIQAANPVVGDGRRQGGASGRNIRCGRGSFGLRGA
jgi:putative endopeptidase